MDFTCRKMMELPGMNKLKLIAGEKGLDRIIRWFHVVDIHDTAKWINGGELLFINGIGLSSDEREREEELMDLMRELNRKNLAGLAITIGLYLDNIPESLLQLSNELEFPLFEVASDVRLINLTQILSKAIFTAQLKTQSLTTLMEEIIYGEFDEDMMNRASFYGYSDRYAYISMVVDIDDFSGYIKKKELEDEEEIQECKYSVMRIIDTTMKKYEKLALTMTRSDSFTVVMPLCIRESLKDVKVKANKFEEIETLLTGLKSDIRESIQGMTVSIGVGGIANELKDLKESVFQAWKTVQIINMCDRKDSLRMYKELGVYRLFFEVGDKEQLEIMYKEFLAPLIKYDKNNNSELLDTLEVLLMEGVNISKTAERLYVHRNTLNYRITKIEEILGVNLKDPNTSFNLLLAIRARKFLDL